MFTLELREGTSLQWVCPNIEGPAPCPRESHAAVTIGNKLLIHGGMNGRRLSDLWLLDIREWILLLLRRPLQWYYSLFPTLHPSTVDKVLWTSVEPQGPPPLPRSLHTAVVIRGRLFAFGGWIPVLAEDGSLPTHETEWKCTNSLCCLRLSKITEGDY